MILAAHALLARTLSPSRADIVEAISGNICRCTGYGSSRPSHWPPSGCGRPTRRREGVRPCGSDPMAVPRELDSSAPRSTSRDRKSRSWSVSVGRPSGRALGSDPQGLTPSLAPATARSSRPSRWPPSGCGGECGAGAVKRGVPSQPLYVCRSASHQRAERRARLADFVGSSFRSKSTRHELPAPKITSLP
jgi:hypothetical protein